MTKMFIHYSGTISAFKAAGLESTYEKSIVFISGDAEGNGAAVYTHNKYYGSITEALASLKYFTSVSDGTTTASATGPNGTITFTGENAAVSVTAGATGVKIGLAAKTVTEEDSTAALSALPVVTEVKADAYGRLDKVKSQTVDIQGAIDTAKAAAVSEANSYADGLASNYDEAGAADDALAAAKEYADGVAATAKSGAEATAAAALSAHAADADIHVTAALQSTWNKAAEDIAAFLDENAVSDDVVNTLKEIQEYIESDGAAADNMVKDIAAAKNAADAAQADATQALTDAAAAQTSANSANAAAEAAQATADEAKANAATAQSAADANTATIAAMDLTAVTGYVTSVSQADGKVSASAVANIPAADITVADADDNFTGATVEAVVSELASMWEWEEL